MKPTIAFFGSSLVSSYWNGAATYYRGLIRALAARGYLVTFYEPDAFERQQHRDLADPPWARVVVYPGDPNDSSGVERALTEAATADVLIKASGVGVFDELIEAALPKIGRRTTQRIFWDVDAPATLDRLRLHPDDPLLTHLPRYDMVLTFGGGAAVVRDYMAAGARVCIPIYNGVDPQTHHPVACDPRFAADLGFLGNRLPDREARVDEWFIGAARAAADRQFILGGNGWHDKPLPANVRAVGHVYARDHNAFNCTARSVLNICRDSMARYGFSPATRVFEAAAAGACLITDPWEGLDAFLEPDTEVLVATDGLAVASIVASLDAATARRIGQAARRRVQASHTYDQRARSLDALLDISVSA